MTTYCCRRRSRPSPVWTSSHTSQLSRPELATMTLRVPQYDSDPSGALWALQLAWATSSRSGKGEQRSSPGRQATFSARAMPSAIMSWVNRSAIAARGCSDDAADAHRTRSAGQPHGPRARLAANLAAHWPRTARRRDPAPCPGRECGVCHDLCAVLVGRAAVVSAADRPVVPRDLARTIAYAGVNLTP